MWELSSAALDEAFKKGDFAGADWQPFLNLWRTPGRYQGRDDEVCESGSWLKVYTFIPHVLDCVLAFRSSPSYSLPPQAFVLNPTGSVMLQNVARSVYTVGLACMPDDENQRMTSCLRTAAAYTIKVWTV